MDKTFTFVVQIDADYETSERELKRALIELLDTAREIQMDGAAGLLSSSTIGQVTVL